MIHVTTVVVNHLYRRQAAACRDSLGTVLRQAWTARLVRFGWGLGIGVAAKLLGARILEYPVFGLLGTNSLGFVTAAGLFGWPGLAGMAAAHLAFVARRGSSGVYLLWTTAAYVVAGALVYLTFRWVPRIGRGMPDLRSFQWYALASGLGSLLTSVAISAKFEPDTFVDSAAVWARSTVVSVWTFGPTLLMLGWWLFRPWLAPIPGEVEPEIRRRFSLIGGDRGGDRERVVGRPEPELGRSFFVGTLLIVAVTLLALTLSRVVPAAGFWLGLLYLFPLYWAARRHRLGGGLCGAAGVGIGFLVLQAVEEVRSGSLESQAQEVQIYAHLLIFLAVGILLGVAWDRETELLEKLAESNRRLRGDLQRVVKALTGAVEAKDLYTEGHLHRVSAFASEVGRRLGLDERDLELLQIASALHDIGKIGIPEHILNKPGCLDADERTVIERHPQIGARILENVDGLQAAAPLVLHHQERYDGRSDGQFPGYPAGLAGESIPLGARIIAVVDAFDAMTTDRAYRRARPVAEAVEVLRSERGRQFDPAVVDVFIELLVERPWT